jgi:hypothetical protein
MEGAANVQGAMTEQVEGGKKMVMVRIGAREKKVER